MWGGTIEGTKWPRKVPRRQGSQGLLATRETVTVAEAAVDPAEEQHPAATVPDEARDAEAAVGAAQKGPGQNDVVVPHRDRDLILVIEHVLPIDEAEVGFEDDSATAEHLADHRTLVALLQERDELHVLDFERVGVDIGLHRVPVFGGNRLGRELHGATVRVPQVLLKILPRDSGGIATGLLVKLRQHLKRGIRHLPCFLASIGTLTNTSGRIAKHTEGSPNGHRLGISQPSFYP